MAFADSFDIVSRRVEQASMAISLSSEVARITAKDQPETPPRKLIGLLVPLLEFSKTHREWIEQCEEMFNRASAGMPICQVRGMENFWLPSISNEMLALMGGVTPLPAPNAHCATVRLVRIFEAWLCSKADPSKYIALVSSPTVNLDIAAIHARWPQSCMAIAQFPNFDGQELRARIQLERSFIIAKIKQGDLAALGLDVGKTNPPPGPNDGPWSEPDTPKRWSKRFGICWDTLKSRLDDGTIRNRKLSTKSYQIHVNDVPRDKSG